MDYFNQYAAANQRISVSQRWPQVDTKNPNTYEGYVTNVGLAEAVERSALVFIPSLKSHVKALISDGAVGMDGIGSSTYLRLGDRVLVNFLQGDASIPQIVGRASRTFGLRAKFLEEGNPIPQPGDKVGDTILNPPSWVVVPEALEFGGQIDITVSSIGAADE